MSGYHMAVVAGVVFFAVRGFLALSPALALRRPIKKWAAVVALVVAAFYLVLSGAEVATQRAFLMTAVVLAGVLADRRALTLRTLAITAMAAMAVAPQAVVHPSFQMSFAATLALVAAYERGLPVPSAGRGSSRATRYALWGAREIIALAVASLVAGAATTAYAAYHFHRLAPYGVLANLVAMPIVSAVAMPAGLFALVMMPFGFDAPLWRLMGLGIEWMAAVAQWVAAARRGRPHSGLRHRRAHARHGGTGAARTAAFAVATVRHPCAGAGGLCGRPNAIAGRARCRRRDELRGARARRAAAYPQGRR